MVSRIEQRGPANRPTTTRGPQPGASQPGGSQTGGTGAVTSQGVRGAPSGGGADRGVDMVTRAAVAQAGAGFHASALGGQAKRRALSKAQENIEDTIDRVTQLIGERLPHLRDLAEVGPTAAENFDRERTAIVSFAGGMPMIDSTVVSDINAIRLAREQVTGLGAVDRIGAASGPDAAFGDFSSPGAVADARNRIENEIKNVLPGSLTQFIAELEQVKAQLIAHGVVPADKRPAKINFAYETPQAFFEEYDDPLAVVPSEGYRSYNQGVQLVGRTFFFGHHLGKNGSKAV